jgi:acetyl esterase
MSILESSAASKPLHLMTVQEARGMLRDPYSTKPVNTTLAGNEIVTTLTINGPLGEIPIRIYAPNGDGPFPILVYFHGGGWVLGSLDGVDTICRRITHRAQAIVVSVNYHLAPEHKFPQPVYEALFATSWVFDHALELGGDHKRLAVGGDSAGANLAAAVTHLAKANGKPKLCAQLLIYPVMNCHFESTSFSEFATGHLLTRKAMEWFRSHYLSSSDEADNPLASPVLATDVSGLPEAYVVTAECDPLRDDAENYAKRLESAGVPVALRRYDGMCHDFMSFAENPWQSDEAVQAIDDTAQMMKSLLHGRAENV